MWFYLQLILSVLVDPCLKVWGQHLNDSFTAVFNRQNQGRSKNRGIIHAKTDCGERGFFKLLEKKKLPLSAVKTISTVKIFSAKPPVPALFFKKSHHKFNMPQALQTFLGAWNRHVLTFWSQRHPKSKMNNPWKMNWKEVHFNHILLPSKTESIVNLELNLYYFFPPLHLLTKSSRW